MPVITNDNAGDAIPYITPIIKVSLCGEVQLIGTGFFITNTGVIVTAKYVITDNIGPDGKDIGGITALHFHNSGVASRGLLYSSLHPVYDLAICETHQYVDRAGEKVLESAPLALTLDTPAIGTPISTHSYHDGKSHIDDEKYPPVFMSTMSFNGAFSVDPSKEVELNFNSRVTVGYVTDHFVNGRDLLMMPFPCFQSDLPVYGGMSGGPVFDDKGRVFAVNCTRVEGTDVAYHTSLEGILDLSIRNTIISGTEDVPHDRTIRELVRLSAIRFD